MLLAFFLIIQKKKEGPQSQAGLTVTGAWKGAKHDIRNEELGYETPTF